MGPRGLEGEQPGALLSLREVRKEGRADTVWTREQHRRVQIRELPLTCPPWSAQAPYHPLRAA